MVQKSKHPLLYYGLYTCLYSGLITTVLYFSFEHPLINERVCSDGTTLCALTSLLLLDTILLGYSLDHLAYYLSYPKETDEELD